MRVLIVGGLSLLLLAAIGLSADLLLQACGVRIPFTQRVISVCETDADRARRDRLAELQLESAGLMQDIQAYERQLAGLQCVAEAPPPPPLPPPKPKPKKPQTARTDSGLTPDAFDKRDISVMQGCWRLVSTYKTSDIRSGKVTTFKQWRVCFDGNGNGRQTMKATNGVTCNGTLKGRINNRKRLVMREGGNLRCSNGSYIYRRDITCTLDAAGRANCTTYQPEVGGRGVATLRRSN